MNDKVKKALRDQPLKYYDNILFLSCNDPEISSEQDFALLGESENIVKHIAAMMLRHDYFKDIVLNATILYAAAKDHYEPFHYQFNC